MREDVGLTPSGGDRTVAFFLDADGNECEPADATRAEIVEYTGDVEIGRTYLDDSATGLDYTTDTFDLEPDNQDLLKFAEWDLWTPGFEKRVETLDEFLAVVESGNPGVPVRDSVCNLLGLPVWEQAPEPLKAEVYGWLRIHTSSS